MPIDDDLLAISGEPAAQLIRQLLDGAPDAMVVIDASGRMLFYNLMAERLFGYARAEALGHDVELLVPERYRGVHLGHRKHYSQAPSVRPMDTGRELYGRRKDGTEFSIEISLSPFHTAGGLLTCASIRDISERKLKEQELQSARALAEAASRSKSEFLASMSHELRTPLNAILGFTQLLARDKKTPLSERQHERVGHVLSAGEHLLHLIDDVLDLASIEAGRVVVALAAVPLTPVLAEVKSTLDPMAQQHNISLQVQAPEDPRLEVLADRTRLKQILMNFGSNAIKYGRLDGRVTISVRATPHTVRICVEDNGIGIAVNQQAKLFQPFQRAGQETGPIEGTGIGLALSKRLVELMRGSVGFTSQLNQGSLFWIELTRPRTAALPLERSAPAEPALEQLRDSAEPRVTIVYIEDNPSNIRFMEDFFSDYKRVDLVTAPSAEIGLALVRDLRPRVVIMDLNLPGMNGLDATLQLAEWPQTRDIPVIALSAAAALHDAKRVRGAGFYRYLEKPVQLDELARTLEELLPP
jgi:PAS domain S-box-containing protein